MAQKASIRYETSRKGGSVTHVETVEIQDMEYDHGSSYAPFNVTTGDERQLYCLAVDFSVDK